MGDFNYVGSSSKDVIRGHEIVRGLAKSEDPEITTIRGKIGATPKDGEGTVLRKLVTALHDDKISDADAKKLSSLMTKSFSTRSKVWGGGDKGRLLAVMGKVVKAEMRAFGKSEAHLSDRSFEVDTSKGKTFKYQVSTKNSKSLERETIAAKEAGFESRTVTQGNISYTQWKYPGHEQLRLDIAALGVEPKHREFSRNNVPGKSARDTAKSQIKDLQNQLDSILKKAEEVVTKSPEPELSPKDAGKALAAENLETSTKESFVTSLVGMLKAGGKLQEKLKTSEEFNTLLGKAIDALNQDGSDSKKLKFASMHLHPDRTAGLKEKERGILEGVFQEAQNLYSPPPSKEKKS